MGAHQAREQECGVHRPERRIVRCEHTGGRRSFEIRRRRAQTHHYGCLHPRRRTARGVARVRAAGRGAGREDRGVRHGRPRNLSPPEEGALAGVPARNRLPASENQYLRCRVAHPPRHGVCHPRVFQQTGLLLFPYAAHHGFGLRGRGRHVPGDDPRPERRSEDR